MQYLDISYRDDFVVVRGDIPDEFDPLAFNIIQKKFVAVDCGFRFSTSVFREPTICSFLGYWLLPDSSDLPCQKSSGRNYT